MRVICPVCGAGGASDTPPEVMPLCHSKLCNYNVTMVIWTREIEDEVEKKYLMTGGLIPLGENGTNVFLTPDNTIRRSKDSCGFRFIEVCDGEGCIDFVAYEVGDWVGAGRILKPLGVWSEHERGPAEFKDLPIRYNNFIPYPLFEGRAE